MIRERESLFRPILRNSLFFLILLFAVPVQAQFDKEESSESEDEHSNKRVKKFHTLLYHLENSYVDSVDGEELTESAIRGMLEDLDPHSVYIPADEVKEMRQPLQGNFDGIGIRFNILEDTILVVNPIPGGPSEKLGIQAGDKIVKIEGETVAGVGIKNSGVRKRLLGEKGTKVEVSIYRKNEPELLHYEIIRDEIPIHSVQANYMVDDKTGYIKVNRFSENTMDEFNEAMEELKEEGMKDLVLDLQGNGGGYLKTAIKMADQFLEKDRLVVYTEGRSFPRRDRNATKEGSFEDGRLVVMVDESSASASEIVAGAVQDWDRGVLVGRRTFGKGLVQRPIELPDGSVVRLTVSRYHTPSGRCIQKPYENGDREDYAKERFSRWESGEMFHLDSIDISDSLRFQTRIKERTVYGGGGVIPDIFVPIDTSGNSDYFQELRQKGILNRTALDYSDEERDRIKADFDSPEAFSEDYEVSDELLTRIRKEAENEGVEFDQEDFDHSREFIQNRLKSMLARNIWGTEAFYRVHNPMRPSYQKALEVLNDGTFEKMDLAETR